ncbi:prepilin-type N-terminal cleavage/methylation domain-containing protein [Acetobacterium wieringae]|uniref:Prepilin-type N-terminal cleavage/methylation domain-containing protein n=1 Tax=Acetobacterium wieringae TaxID=52694 RepID=A0A1F2PHG2_9FIRM|nr:hypothetical protein [Acetobacterium wieringae]OFV70156.1 hypothetical protein ACWI_23610 [Acetobacterium wieringae]
MKKILKNNAGVTLIETVAATAIIAIILVTILGALLYGQKMIVFSDSKNNQAAQAQDLIDSIMSQLSEDKNPSSLSTGDAIKRDSFADPKTITNLSAGQDPRKQYMIQEGTVRKSVNGSAVDYVVYTVMVRIYYNNDESYIELKAFAKKGGVWA